WRARRKYFVDKKWGAVPSHEWNIDGDSPCFRCSRAHDRSPTRYDLCTNSSGSFFKCRCRDRPSRPRLNERPRKCVQSHECNLGGLANTNAIDDTKSSADPASNSHTDD